MTDCNFKKLQRVQNTLARVVLRAGKFEHIIPAFIKLHWLPVKQRVLYKQACSSSNWVLGYGGSWTICGPPGISETTTARKLNLKIPLDMVKYPLWIQQLFYYKIQHESGRHIDFRQMSISPRQTTANNCKTTFSLHVVESASEDYSF